MKPVVSIIVCIYNVEQYLPQCLDSLLTQTLDNIEIILFNDASPDNSLEIMKKYKNIAPDKITIIDSPENRSLGGGRNICIRAAKADLVGFVDPDDFVSPDMFKILYDKIIATGADTVRCEYFSNAGKPDLLENYYPICEKWHETFSEDNLTSADRKKLLFYGGPLWSNLIKKSLFIENDIYFPEKLAYEDMLVGRLLPFYLTRIAFVNVPLYYYRQRYNSIVNTRNSVHFFDRLTVEDLTLAELKKRGLFDGYEDILEYRYILLGLINLLTEYPLKNSGRFHIEEFKKQNEHILKTFPNFQQNHYYIENVDAAMKKEVLLELSHPRLWFVFAKLKLANKKFYQWVLKHKKLHKFLANIYSKLKK